MERNNSYELEADLGLGNKDMRGLGVGIAESNMVLSTPADWMEWGLGTT